MFQAVKTDVSLPDLEQRVLEFWKRERIYETSQEQRQDAPPFIFFEGPPTANGMPHPGHCLTRAIKDLFPRYRTMRGYRCLRKAGWDTHGLPVEVEVCKELGIHGKDEIESYGVEPFIQKCQQSVWRYMQEWEKLTERIGFWINLDEAYVTYHQSYVESVWWSLQQLFQRGLLYRGHKIVWWWAQGGTALSSGEVGQGYRQVADPSVYVRFPLVDQPDTSLLVWTTTPWTLPSNQFAAVHPQLSYATCEVEGVAGKLVVAEGLVESLAEKTKKTWTIIERHSGSHWVGRRYQPPFPELYYQKLASKVGTTRDGKTESIAWRVVPADFVTIDSGTGLVHLAPAFGEVDYEVLIAEQERFCPGEGPQLICAVGPDGKFTQEAPDYQGLWVKDADKLITRRLKEDGTLLLLDQYLHDYPFCWRAESDPLIQYPRESWFIRTTAFREAMLENNRNIAWHPEHIRDGRFGNFLESNVDWALSRERYWGTPLPIWVCDKTGQMEAIGSYDELLAKPGCQGQEVWLEAKAKQPHLVEDLKVHKPYIDAIHYDSPFATGARMRRVPEVIDCWYDSGAMPFAQWGYPHRGRESFADQFPADFISEAIDQTRGWFYSQLAISTMLFGKQDGEETSTTNHPYPHPFKNCIVLGLMLAEWYESKDGKQRFLTEEEARAACGKDFVAKTGKMSKSLRNYRSPNEIFDRYGADALRWYFFANQPPWNSILYSERSIRDSIPEFLMRLWNVFSFFTIYAEIDRFDASRPRRASAQRSELDRWMLGELALANQRCIESMDHFDNYTACQALTDLVENLSNWYVRRSRSRYWSDDHQSHDKWDAYWTLAECLTTISQLIAPFTPFLAETLWQAMQKGLSLDGPQSVHLSDYPTPDPSRIDPQLSQRMRLLREIASLGRSARMDAKLKVRQPLSRVEVTLADATHRAWLETHDEILREELNVKAIDYTSGASPYIEYQIQPNFRKLGPKIGSQLPKLKAALASLEGGSVLREMNQHGTYRMTLGDQVIELDADDLQVRLKARDGWAAAQGKQCVVVLATEITDALRQEGIVKDAIRAIQELRKKSQCRFTDRIVLQIAAPDEVRQAMDLHQELWMGETLTKKVEWVEPTDHLQAIDVGDHQAAIALRTIES
ncbi:MAG: isoleucine--tRNA ligase [Pirellulaceae bacterium]